MGSPPPVAGPADKRADGAAPMNRDDGIVPLENRPSRKSAKLRRRRRTAAAEWDPYRTSMHRYSVYGRCLASELEFPQLEPSRSELHDWVLRVRSEPPELQDCRQLGTEQIADISIQLIRHRDGYRVEHADTGIFDIAPNGRDIAWYVREDVDMEVLCADLTGRVLATAMLVKRKLALHGSTIVLPSGGLTFVGPKGYGKSALAMAMTAAGARLAGDDLTVLEPGDEVVAWPGLGSVRLWPATAERLGLASSATEVGSSGKVVVRDPIAESQLEESFKLSAVYVLTPMTTLEEGVAAERVRLTGVEAALALMPHTKVGALLSGPEAATTLQLVGAVVRALPVYRLRVVRDMERIREVVQQLLEWHGPTWEPSGEPGP
jgi:hypothetical protein